MLCCICFFFLFLLGAFCIMGVWFGMEWDDTLFLHIVFGVQGGLRFGRVAFYSISGKWHCVEM
jgi:LytS/YehU family sensor histidine kinase